MPQTSLLFRPSLVTVSCLLCYYTELSDLVKEAEENDGRLARRPLRNIHREIEAHKILIARITRLVEEYEVSIEVK